MKQTLFSLLMMLLPLAHANAVRINGIYYNLIKETKLAEVTQSPNHNYSGNIAIPSSVVDNKVTYSVTSIGNTAFIGCKDLTSVTIPNSVTAIGDAAFCNCSGLTSVNIPNSLTSIGSQAFYNCSGLTSITIPNSVTAIKDLTFRDCSGLTSVTIPNSATYIGNYAFYGCSGLTSVTISNSVKSIGERAFWGCSSLTSVTIPNSVTSIGYLAFCECSGLTSITIPNSVTSIGSRAFYKCSGLTSITIPNSVTSIRENAFYNCSGLTSVTIPNSVTTIEAYAFCKCSSLTDVYCYAENVPNTDTNAFNSSDNEHATLHVPASAFNDYSNAVPWSKFKDIVAIGEQEQSYTLTYMLDGIKYVECNVREGETITPEPAPTKEGYTFFGWSEIPETMPAHDVTVTGSFTKITHEQCAMPTIVLKDGKLIFECETPDVEFSYNITANGSKSGIGNYLSVTPSFTVRVFASKEGMEDSETAAQVIYYKNGDANGDGQITVTDIGVIVDMILGKTTAGSRKMQQEVEPQ